LVPWFQRSSAGVTSSVLATSSAGATSLSRLVVGRSRLDAFGAREATNDAFRGQPDDPPDTGRVVSSRRVYGSGQVQS
jgi:hypothetical protein